VAVLVAALSLRQELADRVVAVSQATTQAVRLSSLKGSQVVWLQQA